MTVMRRQCACVCVCVCLCVCVRACVRTWARARARVFPPAQWDDAARAMPTAMTSACPSGADAAHHQQLRPRAAQWWDVSHFGCGLLAASCAAGPAPRRMRLRQCQRQCLSHARGSVGWSCLLFGVVLFTFWGGPFYFWGGPGYFRGGPIYFRGGPLYFRGGPLTRQRQRLPRRRRLE